MIRLGSLAGYPFEGPRLLGGWTPPSAPAVYAIAYKPDPDAKPDQYAVIYVDHADDLAAARFPSSTRARTAGSSGPAPGGRSTSAPTRSPAAAAGTGSR